MVEEGQPDFIEQALNTILRRADIQTRVDGKGMLPMAGEYTGGVMKAGLRKFVAAYRPDLLPDARAPAAPRPPDDRLAKAQQAVAGKVHGRPPSFCTGCPERPIFAAMKLVERELGAAPRELRHRLPPVLDPAAVQSRQHHHGLWPRRRRRRGAQRRRRQTRHRARWATAASGTTASPRRRQCRLQQERQRADRGRQRLFGRDRRAGHALLAPPSNSMRATRNPIEKAVRGVGVKWVRTLTRTYDVAQDARHAAGGAHDGGQGTQGHHRPVRMHAQQAAPGAAAAAQAPGRRQARGARTLRRRPRHLHRRSLLHPALRLPLAHARAQSRSAAARAGRPR